jgi:hypothetical protein
VLITVFQLPRLYSTKYGIKKIMQEGRNKDLEAVTSPEVLLTAHLERQVYIPTPETSTSPIHVKHYH